MEDATDPVPVPASQFQFVPSLFVAIRIIGTGQVGARAQAPVLAPPSGVPVFQFTGKFASAQAE